MLTRAWRRTELQCRWSARFVALESGLQELAAQTSDQDLRLQKFAEQCSDLDSRVSQLVRRGSDQDLRHEGIAKQSVDLDQRPKQVVRQCSDQDLRLETDAGAHGPVSEQSGEQLHSPSPTDGGSDHSASDPVQDTLHHGLMWEGGWAVLNTNAFITETLLLGIGTRL